MPKLSDKGHKGLSYEWYCNRNKTQAYTHQEGWKLKISRQHGKRGSRKTHWKLIITSLTSDKECWFNFNGRGAHAVASKSERIFRTMIKQFWKFTPEIEDEISSFVVLNDLWSNFNIEK